MDIYAAAKIDAKTEIRAKRKERSKTFQLPDGRRRHLCFGAPIHYMTDIGAGERPDRRDYDDIDIRLTHFAAEAQKDFGNHIAAKNKFTYGFRDDGKSEKYIGIRRGSSNQMEWTLRNVNLGNIEKTVPAVFTASAKLNDFSFKHDYADYDIITDFNEVHIRTAVKTKFNIGDFTIREEIDLTGIKITNKLVDGEYIPDAQNRFNFITTDNELLWIPTPKMWVEDEEDDYRKSREITHRLFIQDKKLIYEKTPTEKGKDWLTSKTGSVFIDGDTYTGSTGDGAVSWHGRSGWDDCHDNSFGDSAYNNASYDGDATQSEADGDNCCIRRAFLFFDTSALGDNVESCDLKVYGHFHADTSVSAQLSTISGTTVNSNDQYNDFSGSEYGHVSWSASAWNTILFNATGISDISSTGYTKVCLREYTYDYLDSEPSGQVEDGVYFAEDSTYKPYLDIVDSAASEFIPQIVMF